MKGGTSKSFKEYPGNSSTNKRAVSPLPNTANQPPLQSNSNTKSVKKKPIGSSPYQKAIK